MAIAVWVASKLLSRQWPFSPSDKLPRPNPKGSGYTNKARLRGLNSKSEMLSVLSFSDSFILWFPDSGRERRTEALPPASLLSWLLALGKSERVASERPATSDCALIMDGQKPQNELQ